MILDSGVYLWQVADALGICDTTLTKHLRKDFTAAQVEQIQAIITVLQEAKKSA